MKEGGMEKSVRYFLQKEYEVIFELSSTYSVLSLCKEMKINRSGFYKWLDRRSQPSKRQIVRDEACELFEKYHKKFPSHGYHWLNTKIKLHLDITYSDNFSHKICKFLGIKSESKHVKRYGKNSNKEMKNFPNYILAELSPSRPFEVVSLI